MCIFGAIISDSWLGKFKTILILSVVYTAGSTVIAVGAIPTLNLPTMYVQIKFFCLNYFNDLFYKSFTDY